MLDLILAVEKGKGKLGADEERGADTRAWSRAGRWRKQGRGRQRSGQTQALRTEYHLDREAAGVQTPRTPSPAQWGKGPPCSPFTPHLAAPRDSPNPHHGQGHRQLFPFN